jgi:hypothetical protein
MPSTPSLFSRSWTASGNGKQRCIPAQRLCWIRLESDTFIFVGIYFCLLVLQSIVLWRSTGHLDRFIRSLFKATPTERKPNYQQLEEVVVQSESTVPLESLDTVTSQSGRNELRRISKRSQQHAQGYSMNLSDYGSSTSSSRGNGSSTSSSGNNGYRPATAWDNKTTISSRNSVVVHQEYARGYNAAEPHHPGYGGGYNRSSRR